MARSDASGLARPRLAADAAPAAGWRPSLLQAAVAILVLGGLAIGGAWFSQLVLGLQPCELCLLQRWPYYVGLPLALAAALARRRSPAGARGLVALVGLVFLAGAGLGAYHAGVEWGLWAGPTGCTGRYAPSGDMGDFVKSLQSVQVVRCDQAALRVLGLSLAGWNALVSLALALIAAAGAWRSAYA